MPAERYQSFADFWPYYMREHARPLTRWLHFAGTTTALAIMAMAAALGAWRWLWLVPVAGYGVAWISHLAIERNRPATFTRPLWSLAADFKMWWLIATGRMPRELKRLAQLPDTSP
jgi:hypothetical protein